MLVYIYATASLCVPLRLCSYKSTFFKPAQEPSLKQILPGNHKVSAHRAVLSQQAQGGALATRLSYNTTSQRKCS